MRETGASNASPGVTAIRARVAVAIFAVALAARIAALVLSGPSTTKFGDAEPYLRAAEGLLATGTYADNAEMLPLFRPPGYPAFLALSTLGHPREIVVDKLWNAFLGAVAAVLLWVLALLLFVDERTAIFCGFAAALHPGFLLFTTDVQSEGLFMTLLLAFAALLVSGLRRPDGWHLLFAGLILGLATLTRPSALLLAPLLGLTILEKDRPLSRKVFLTMCGVAGLATAVLPWTARNAVRFGGFLLVSDQPAVALYQGNSDAMVAFYRLRTAEDYVLWSRAYDQEAASGETANIGRNYPNPVDRARAFTAAATSWIRSHPKGFVSLLGHKVLDWLRPWANPLVRGRTEVAASGLLYVALFGLAAAGLVLERNRLLTGVALYCFVAAMAAHLLAVPLMRYRIPFWDPILILFASRAIVRFSPSNRTEQGFTFQIAPAKPVL